MPISLPTHLSTSQTLWITALATAITTTSLVLTFQSLRREHRIERLKKQVGEDEEEWEKSHPGSSGAITPEEKAEKYAQGEMRSAGGRKVKEWAKGEFDEGLIREQVGWSFGVIFEPWGGSE